MKRRWWTLTLMVTALAAPVHAADQSCIDYIYIEANEASASGGHAAVRLGDTTYHFQNEAPGVLRLQRDDWHRFVHRYAGLENRPMHRTCIAASPTVARAVQRAFASEYWIQTSQFERLDELRTDRALLALFLAQRGDGDVSDDFDQHPALAVRGAGYFLPDSDATESIDASSHAPALLALREHVSRTYGADFLERKRRTIVAALQALAPPPGDELPQQLNDSPSSTQQPSFSRDYTNLTTQLIALQVLDAALPLRPGTYRVLTDTELLLQPEERSALRALGAQLDAQLVRLLGSQRPDPGFALLVGMARLVTLDLSLQHDRLVVLDAFPPDAELIDARTVAQQDEVVRALDHDGRDDLQHAREHVLRASQWSEADYNDLEAAANRLVELHEARESQRSLRVATGRLLPARVAWRADLVAPALTTSALRHGLVQARARQRVYQTQLLQRYGYQLITHNCVTELLRTINAALDTHTDAGPDDIEAASTQSLGGYVDPDGELNFIPFVSAHNVQRAFRIETAADIASYRRAQLAAMYRDEPSMLVYLRESNTLTSTIYRGSAEDSTFLFFTDDVVAPRPLFGAINLITGIGAGLGGIVQLPWDRGHALVAGLRGVVFSVPELVWINLRKGSFDYVPRGAFD